MSVSLAIFKGEKFDPLKSEFVSDTPFSFQRVYNEHWKKAEKECGITFFKSGMMFTADDIPQVLDELMRLDEWAAENGCGDRGYMQYRIQEMTDLLTDFLNSSEGGELSEYWFDVG